MQTEGRDIACKVPIFLTYKKNRKILFYTMFLYIYCLI